MMGDRIGSGGLGVVYRASDITQTSGAVAIKLIREEFAQDPVLTRRLKHEAILVDRLNHPNIVHVYERGEHEQTLYIVMELLLGRSLAEALRGGPLEIPTCLSIGLQLADALAAIHARGIVHRDLKPENVMVVEQQGGPLVKLLDFDLARGGERSRASPKRAASWAPSTTSLPSRSPSRRCCPRATSTRWVSCSTRPSPA